MAQTTTDPSAYLNFLYGSRMQTSLSNKQVPAEFLAFCIESGVVDVHDEALLFEIEKAVGQRIKPKVQPSMNIKESKNAPARSSQQAPASWEP